MILGYIYIWRDQTGICVFIGQQDAKT